MKQYRLSHAPIQATSGLHILQEQHICKSDIGNVVTVMD